MTAETSVGFCPPCDEGFCGVELRDSMDSPTRGIGVAKFYAPSLAWDIGLKEYRCSVFLEMESPDGTIYLLEKDDVPGVLLWRTVPTEDVARSCLARAKEGLETVPCARTIFKMQKSFLSRSDDEFQRAAAAALLTATPSRSPPIKMNLHKTLKGSERYFVDLGVLDLIAPYLEEDQKDKCNLGAVSRSLRQACSESKEMNRRVEAVIPRIEDLRSFRFWMVPQRAAVVEELIFQSDVYDPFVLADIFREVSREAIGKLELKIAAFNRAGNKWNLPTKIWDLRQLKSLSIECGIDVIPPEIKHLQALTFLELCVDVVTLPPELGLLTGLRRLELNQCDKLQSIPVEIGQLKMLTMLYISGCESLPTLPPSIGMLTSLQSLCLNFCNFRTLPPEIGGLTALKGIQMEGCRELQLLPPQISSLISLDYLTLSGNRRMASLPPEISGLQKLEYLRCENCNLRNLAPEIGNIKSLKELNLTDCFCLQELPLELGQAAALTKLILRGCDNLGSLPQAITQLKALKVLDLGRRHINYICFGAVLAELSHMKEHQGLEIK